MEAQDDIDMTPRITRTFSAPQAALSRAFALTNEIEVIPHTDASPNGVVEYFRGDQERVEHDRAQFAWKLVKLIFALFES
jgi:hypothetical protein